jgi:predicted nucleic acid-binding protein
MSGNKVVLDTNVIIFASKSKVDFSLLAKDYEKFYVSIITYMEVYGYNFENEDEKILIEELFKTLKVVHINDAIAEKTYSTGHGW